MKKVPKWKSEGMWLVSRTMVLPAGRGLTAGGGWM